MKRAVIIFLAMLFISAGTISFVKSTAKEFRASGIISNVEADGNSYTATLQADDGKEYITVAASIPVQKKMLMLESGDKVVITGSVVPYKKSFNIEVKDILKNN